MAYLLATFSRRHALTHPCPMSVQELMRSLDEVAATLPFPVDDYERANEAFLRWRTGRDLRARDVVERWVFCYSRRYFIAKFSGRTGISAADFDRAVGEAYRRIIDRLDDIQEPDRFVNYASVVCKSTYVNFRRRASRSRRRHVPLDHAPEPAAPEVDPFEGYDRQVLRHALGRAIHRLPESLRAVVELRYLQKLSYEEMERETGHPLATLRSYVSKALQKLRRDEALRDLFDSWDS